MSETVTCCPECGNSSLSHSPGGGQCVRLEHDPIWKCKHCKSTFETPAQRESKAKPHIWHNHFDGCRLCGCTEFVDESSDEATQIVPDGGHRHDTDRVDGFFIAECPNASDPDDDHLQIEVNYERATNADELIAEIRETWPDCGECGSALQCLGANEPSEIITDGGREEPSPIWTDWIDPDDPVRSVTIARVVQVGDGASAERSRGDIVLWPGEHAETRIWETANERDDPQQTVIRATCHVSLGAVVAASNAVDHYRTLARSSASELGWPAGAGTDQEESGNSEVVTDGGANTYLVDDDQWYALGLIESALGRREEGRWEACRRLTQHAIVKLDRGTRAHRIIRDGCCAESHPREDQWRDALERAKSALEVRDR